MILTFNDNFISQINSRYNYKGYTQVLIGKRFYATTVTINTTPFILCIPLHSNCTRHFLHISPPTNDLKWKSHGLDYQKMLILKIKDIEDNATIAGVDSSVWDEIVSKKESLTKLVKDYLMYYMNLTDRRFRGEKLKRQEDNDLNYSSLNCFAEYLSELSQFDLSNLDFIFNDVSSIEDLSEIFSN